jgi:hypothetical protein
MLLACPKMRKFVVEVVRSIGADDEIMTCVDIEEDSLRKARLKARLLLAPWRKFGATSTRLRGMKRRTRAPDRASITRALLTSDANDP